METRNRLRSTGIGTGNGLADMAPAELATRVGQISKILDQVDALLEGAVTLDEPQRRKTVRLRGEGELAALDGVLQFAAVHEPLFVALADEDEGVDRTTFETTLVSGRLANAQTLSALSARIHGIQVKVSDTALYATSLSKPVALKAWEVAKVYVDRYPEQKALLAPAVNFYRGNAIAAAKTRQRKKEEAQSTAPTTTTATPTTPQK